MRRLLIVLGLLLGLSACGRDPGPATATIEPDRSEASDRVDVTDPRCTLPAPPEVVVDAQGAVLKVWRLTLAEVHQRPVLPDAPGLRAYREALRAAGAVERHPALHIPPRLGETEARVWEDEELNNARAYRGGVGSIEPLTCLDALLFAAHDARIPQRERPTEFIASVLHRKAENTGEHDTVVIFGAGSEMFPPRSVYGFDLVEQYRAQGWTYTFLLHNHTTQADGTLGVPVPSTSDVALARNLAESLGLQRVRVTNGFYTFDAAVEELAAFRAR